jgi:large subunit ribosomal protein L4
LVLLPGQNVNVELSARNLPQVKALRAHYLNMRDLLGHEKLVLPLSALDVLKSFLDSGRVTRPRPSPKVRRRNHALA